MDVLASRNTGRPSFNAYTCWLGQNSSSWCTNIEKASQEKVLSSNTVFFIRIKVVVLSPQHKPFLIVPLLSRGSPETLEPHRAFAYGGISHCLCRAITSICTPRITASQVNFDIHLTLAYISQHDLLPLNCINRSLGTLLFQASVQSFYAPPFFLSLIQNLNKNFAGLGKGKVSSAST